MEIVIEKSVEETRISGFFDDIFSEIKSFKSISKIVLCGNNLEQLEKQCNRERTDAIVNSVCSICFENINEGESVRKLYCSHKYHRCCVDSWLIENTTCPVCRHDVFKK